MRKLWLLVGLLVLSLPGLARANSYLDVFAVVHDPIMYTAAYDGGAHHYSGDNLEPFADLSNVSNLGFMILDNAVLYYANPSDANLFEVGLVNATLGDVGVAGGGLNRALNPSGSPRDPFLGSGRN